MLVRISRSFKILLIRQACTNNMIFFKKETFGHFNFSRCCSKIYSNVDMTLNTNPILNLCREFQEINPQNPVKPISISLISNIYVHIFIYKKSPLNVFQNVLLIR